jgi:hypothetical protein
VVPFSAQQEDAMTDISTIAPITNHHLELPKLSFPRFGIGALLAAIPGSMRDAFTLAYLDPYSTARRQPEIAKDADLERRDPSW